MNNITLFGKPNIKSPKGCIVERTHSWKTCRDLISMWHSTLPNIPPGFKLAFIAYAPNYEPVACATWGRPVARLEDYQETLELTRLAHSPHVPKNFGSWILGQMRRYIRENMPEIKRLISYQDANIHQGTIYKANNWTQIYDKTTSHSWTNRSGRLGTERQHKIKWETIP